MLFYNEKKIIKKNTKPKKVFPHFGDYSLTILFPTPTAKITLNGETGELTLIRLSGS